MLIAAALASVGLIPFQAELSFTGFEGVALKGSLVLPSKAQKNPVVILLPGSGPTDRNGNQPPALVTDLLKSIATDLAKAGIGTFRFDKRAAHSNSAIWPKDLSKADHFFRFESFVGDAVAAVKLVKNRPDVDPSRVGLAGHSEGGLITICAVSQEPQLVKAIALLGTAGRSLDLVMKEQIDSILTLQGATPDVHKQHMESLSTAIDHVKRTATTPTKVLPGLRALFGPGTAKLLQAYFTIDPVKELQNFSGPVLVLQGEMDSQISATSDFPLLVDASKRRKSGSNTSVIVEGASHNLKPVQKKSDTGFVGAVAPKALDSIVAFFKKEL